MYRERRFFIETRMLFVIAILIQAAHAAIGSHIPLPTIARGVLYAIPVIIIAFQQYRIWRLAEEFPENNETGKNGDQGTEGELTLLSTAGSIKEIKQYRKPCVKKENIQKLQERLCSAMLEEKLFQLEDLRASQLAAAIGIRPHHLSELLNLHMNLTFSQFVKKIRVNEAKKQISANPSLTLLHIAFENGFQSRSVFNRQFREITGMSPGEFRSMVISHDHSGSKRIA